MKRENNTLYRPLSLLVAALTLLVPLLARAQDAGEAAQVTCFDGTNCQPVEVTRQPALRSVAPELRLHATEPVATGPQYNLGNTGLKGWQKGLIAGGTILGAAATAVALGLIIDHLSGDGADQIRPPIGQFKPALMNLGNGSLRLNGVGIAPIKNGAVLSLTFALGR